MVTVITPSCLDVFCAVFAFLQISSLFRSYQHNSFPVPKYKAYTGWRRSYSSVIAKKIMRTWSTTLY